jgi:hypothetical protein
MAPQMSDPNIQILLFFDFTFMMDRVLDLFVGYYKPSGQEEHRLAHVMYANLSSKFFLEIIVIFVPIILYNVDNDSLTYLLIKMPRYTRLFEI